MCIQSERRFGQVILDPSENFVLTKVMIEDQNPCYIISLSGTPATDAIMAPIALDLGKWACLRFDIKSINPIIRLPIFSWSTGVE
ncbi:hypothetical protein AYI68_g3095 [Smittium mucronatum]|uniref:Uncharacterized protein n=1 Tax=Smittium mucronatum TaxID=133383 RepID=A0A1R0H0W6_9FUNG|nr:hypothetical protein AYI68_g3095 [Smittium mucronatum]